jgi:CheY-like chemotaxis protein
VAIAYGLNCPRQRESCVNRRLVAIGLTAPIELMLEELGCTEIFAASNVADAVGLLAGQSFDVAMVDVNLRGEKSYPVADVLTQRGIPFAFSTGYGDHGVRTDFDDRPVLKKPYYREDLAEVFELLLNDQALPAAA